jgi:hypothetical protein
VQELVVAVLRRTEKLTHVNEHQSRQSSHRLLAAVVVVVAILCCVWAVVSRQKKVEETRILARYQQLRVAISIGNTALTLAMVAPDFRSNPNFNFGLLQNFATPLGPQSSVEISGLEAFVFPKRVFHYRVLRGGDSLGMVKVDGEWFFTGKVFID